MRFRRDYTPSILQHAGEKKNVSSNQILHNSVFENNQSANPCCGDFWGRGEGGSRTRSPHPGATTSPGSLPAVPSWPHARCRVHAESEGNPKHAKSNACHGQRQRCYSHAAAPCFTWPDSGSAHAQRDAAGAAPAVCVSQTQPHFIDPS